MSANEYVTEGHLGGYVVGGDDATYYPELWAWLVHSLNISSVLDVGCGEGHALQCFRNLGCTVLGIDGIPQPDPAIMTHDFTEGIPPLKDMGFYDLVWCCEFVEHVEQRYIANFLRVFKLAPLVVMTHADVGQQGYHHVNCKPPTYWMGVMAAIGYHLDGALTQACRAHASRNRSPYNHFVRSGLVFRRLGVDQPAS